MTLYSRLKAARRVLALWSRKNPTALNSWRVHAKLIDLDISISVEGILRGRK